MKNNYNKIIEESNTRIQNDLITRISFAKKDFADDKDFLEDALKEIMITAKLT